jgi:bacteriorhodopsin
VEHACGKTSTAFEVVHLI